MSGAADRTRKDLKSSEGEAAPRVALVTGAAGGIGAACATALAAAGFRVVVHCNSSRERARELAESLGGGAFAVRADLGDSAQLDSMVAELRERVGRVDVLVNNAGCNRNAMTATMKLEDFDAVAAVGRGTWYLTKLIVRRFMLRAGSGRIINISSVVGHTGNGGQVPYTMEKAGLDAMTKSLAKELGERGILVNSVAPGFIDTDMSREIPALQREEILSRIPLARLGSPEEVAEVVAFLAGGAAYVTGTVVHVNGGMYGG